MSRKRFYTAFLAATVIFALALGLSAGIHIGELAKRCLIGLILGAIAGLAAAPAVSLRISRLDPILSGWGMDIGAPSGPKDRMLSAALAAAVPVFVLFMLAYSLFSPYIEPGYISRGRLSDEKLLALVSLDEFTYRETAERYHFSMDGTQLDLISEAAVNRLRSPDKIREAALTLGIKYRPVPDDIKSRAFLRALSRLGGMNRQDHIERVYYGLREYAKDRGIGAPLGAMLKIVEISGDKVFLKSVVDDVTTLPEVRSAAETRLKALE